MEIWSQPTELNEAQLSLVWRDKYNSHLTVMFAHIYSRLLEFFGWYRNCLLDTIKRPPKSAGAH